MSTNWTEWIGYGASILVAVSLMMKSMNLLRWLNLSGALFFVLYGFLIDSWPVILMNTFLVGVNSWHLISLSLVKK
jgi:hypothetical protein